MAKREYNNDYGSVTQILDVLRKIGLENWFKYNTPQFIKAVSEKGKLIGTQIHDAIHLYIETGKTRVETEYPNEVTFALKSFMQFRKDYPSIKLKNSEVAMTSERHKFNGTRDCDGEEGIITIILDWKSRNAKDKDKPDIYDEDKYQISAYDYLFQETESVIPAYDYVLALAKDKIAYNLYKLEREEADFYFNRIFLPTLGIYNAQKESRNLERR